MRVCVSSLIAVAAALALGACGGKGTNATPAVGPTCAPPSGITSVLVYPAPGSSGVNDGNGQIVIGSTAALPTGTSTDNWNIVVIDSVYPGGTGLPGGLVTTAPPFPSPNATPPFANPVYQTQAFGAPFQAGQTVNVSVNNQATNCAPLLLGQFST